MREHGEASEKVCVNVKELSAAIRIHVKSTRLRLGVRVRNAQKFATFLHDALE